MTFFTASAQLPLQQRNEAKMPSLAHAKEIARCGEDGMIALGNGKGSTVWIVNRGAQQPVATLRGTEELDVIGSVGPRGVFSRDCS